MKSLALPILLFLVSCSSVVKPDKPSEPTYTEGMPTQEVMNLIKDIQTDLKSHPGFQRIKKRHGIAKVFVSNIQVKTKKKIPVYHLNQELSFEMPTDFEYVSDRVRDPINKQAKYESDGMVDNQTLDLIKNKAAPDVIFYGYLLDDVSEEHEVYTLVLHAMDMDRGTELMKIRSRVRISMK